MRLISNLPLLQQKRRLNVAAVGTAKVEQQHRQLLFRGGDILLAASATDKEVDLFVTVHSDDLQPERDQRIKAIRLAVRDRRTAATSTPLASKDQNLPRNFRLSDEAHVFARLADKGEQYVRALHSSRMERQALSQNPLSAAEQQRGDDEKVTTRLPSLEVTHGR